MYVELDVYAPLRHVVLVNHNEQKIQYGSIHLICLQCGRYSHDKSHWPLSNEGMAGCDGNSLKEKEGCQGSSSKPAGDGMQNREAQERRTEGSAVRFEAWMVTQRPCLGFSIDREKE